MPHATLSKSIGLHAAALFLLTLVGPANSGDWPQILGPERNGRTIGEGPILPWGELTPEWSVKLGQGYAGPVVAQGRVVGFHRVGDSEVVAAWDAKSGTQHWRTDFEATYREGYNADKGPRCVPLIHEDYIYLFGAAGDLHCVALSDGKKRWSRDTYGDFDGREGYFGVGSTPIISDGKLLANIGGRNAGIVAFNVETGETIWQKTREGASYSSPTKTTLGGKPAVIFVTRANTLAIDPSNGDEIFQFPFGQRGATVNAATPLVFGDRLFVSSSYGVGARLARISPTEAVIEWSNDESMSSQYNTCVYSDGFLYGTHGREDYKTGEFRCLDAATGEVRWSASQVGVAHVLLINDQLLILNTKGQLILAPATPEGFQPLADAVLTDRLTRALPAFSGGRLYLRDTGNLHCFQLAK